MKSISDILSSMVQPAEQNPLFGSNSTASSQSANSQAGSFGDVLSRLTSQNASSPDSGADGNVQTSNNGTPATNTSTFSGAQVNITDVQVKETVEANNANSTTLKNIESTVASVAAALTQLVQLASNLQNLNPAQAQNLLVQASGGALTASQAQQLVSQLTAFKDQQTGQSALNLTASQQGTLVSQLLQNMLQNQQITVTPAASSQGATNNNQNFSSLQFNFAGGQNSQGSGTTIESLSVNVETLNLQVSNLNAGSANGQAGSSQATALTDSTTQRLTQLLQQLNVAPSNSPVNIQVQSSVASVNSPDLAMNFQNLVQILTQANAGQVVLNNFLSQNNNGRSDNLQQAFNQLTQTQNTTLVQPGSVTGASSTGFSNSASISANAQNLSEETLKITEQSLTVTTNGQNVEIKDVQLQVTGAQIENQQQGSLQNQVLQSVNNTLSQSAQPAVNVQASTTSVVAQTINNTTQPLVNSQVSLPTTSVAAQAADNTPVQPTINFQALAQNANNASVQPAQPTVNTQALVPVTPAVTPNSNSTQVQSNQSAVAIQTGTQNTNNTPVQPTQTASAQTNNNPVQTTQSLVEIQAPQAPNPTAPVVVQVANDTPSQPSQTIVNVQTPTSVVTQALPVQTTDQQASLIPPTAPAQVVTSVPNTTPVSATTVQANTDQSQLALTNGQLEALNTIVARFNSGVIQTGPTGPDTNTLKGNTFLNVNVNPAANTSTGALIKTPAAQALTQTAQALTPVEQTTASVNTTVSTQQNTQLTSALTQNNVQAQAVQPTSQTQQQTVNTLSVANQDAFVQTGANTNANGSVNTTAPAVAPALVNNTPVTAPATTAANPIPAQQGSVNDQPTVQAALPTSTSTNTTPVQVQAPVVTQPVVNPASVTAQNVPAATVVGEAVKAAVVAPAPANAPVVNNAPVVANVSAAQAVQPVTAQAVTQAPVTTESSTALNVSVNSTKDNLANTTDLQNLVASVNAGVTAASDKQNNNFQNTVNTVANSNPNGSVDSAAILNQISQQVAAQADSAKMVSRLNFQLVPESLGRVTVQVALVDQSVSARIVVSNPDVREVLQQHMVDLKAALSQAGLQIDQMQVQVQGGGANLLAQYYQYQQEGNSFRNSAWVPNAPAEEAANADNSSVSTPIYSNALVNILA